jgi:hypothetical protein
MISAGAPSSAIAIAPDRSFAVLAQANRDFALL